MLSVVNEIDGTAIDSRRALKGMPMPTKAAQVAAASAREKVLVSGKAQRIENPTRIERKPAKPLDVMRAGLAKLVMSRDGVSEARMSRAERAGQKCGVCVNCTNPQRKKACEVMRARQEVKEAQAALAASVAARKQPSRLPTPQKKAAGRKQSVPKKCT